MHRRHIGWIATALGIATLAGGCRPVGSEASLGPMPDPYPILLLGSGKRWQVGYPTAEGRFLRPADFSGETIRVPSATRVELIFKSDDYIYTFAVPKCGIKEVAVPELEFRTAFCVAASGQFELISTPMCGASHSAIQNRFVVESRDRFLEWLADKANHQTLQ